MKILLSAYACHPYEGSESSIGWNFGKELAKKGHEVYILTKNPVKEVAFKKEISKLKLQNNLFVIYYDLPALLQRLYKPATTVEVLYYYMWQIGAYFFAKKILKKIDFDVIHHITLGVFRIPSFLYLFDKPFVFGPVGGGEECPPLLRKKLPAKFKLKELVRTGLNRLSRFDPLLNHCFRYSDLILLKTDDNLRFIPKKYHEKCLVELEVGIKSLPELGKSTELIPGEINILYAGRLIYVKGLHLAIKAYAQVVKDFPKVNFTMVGSGPDEEWLKGIARQEGVLERIKWVPKVEQEVLFEMYRDFDLLLFPSLHDSSGGVVLEAISFGMPVVCLDVGGPKEIVDKDCSLVVATKDLGEQEVVANITEALSYLITQPEKLKTMGEHAIIKSKGYTWERVVGRVYSGIEEKVFDLHLVS